MPRDCQVGRPCAVAVAGVAGSGKSTLGRALATHLRLPLLDLDALTNPLLDGLPGTLSPGHWLASPDRLAVRDARYAALRSVARDVVATAGGVVLVAPFSAEMRGGPAWSDLVTSVAPAPLRVVHLSGDAALLARRRAARGEPRDGHRPPDAVAPPPAVPHIALAAELAPDQRLVRALRALGCRSAIDPRAALFGAAFEAVLFDLDGVLVDSTASVVRSWDRFAREFGVSAAALRDNHGRPAAVLVERLLGPDRVAEGLDRIEAIEAGDARSVAPGPGARRLYAGVPAHRRAVVTSGTHRVATARLAAAGFAEPGVLVTAGDVRHGKPDPEPYRLAARRLGVPPGRCLAVEDAPAGIAAALAAGCQVLAVEGTVPAAALAEAGLVVDGLDRVAIRAAAGLLALDPHPDADLAPV